MFKDKPMPTFMAKKMFERHSLNKLGEELKILNSGIIKPGYHILDIGCGLEVKT